MEFQESHRIRCAARNVVTVVSLVPAAKSQELTSQLYLPRPGFAACRG